MLFCCGLITESYSESLNRSLIDCLLRDFNCTDGLYVLMRIVVLALFSRYYVKNMVPSILPSKTYSLSSSRLPIELPFTHGRTISYSMPSRLQIYIRSLSVLCSLFRCYYSNIFLYFSELLSKSDIHIPL